MSTLCGAREKRERDLIRKLNYPIELLKLHLLLLLKKYKSHQTLDASFQCFGTVFDTVTDIFWSALQYLLSIVFQFSNYGNM